MLKAITATSTKNASDDIVADLIIQANAKLGIYRPSVGIFYASCEHDCKKLRDILQGVVMAFPGVKILGSSVTGGYSEKSGYIKDGYFLCLLVSDTIQMIAGCMENISTLMTNGTFRQQFRSITQQSITGGKDITACLFFTPYNNVDGNELIDTLHRELPEQCIVFGGMATDHWTEQDLATFSKKTPPVRQTLSFFAQADQVHIGKDSLVFLLFTGELVVQSFISYGWSDIGMLYPGRADNFFLTELDGKDPYLFLKEMKHPLAADEYGHAEYSLWFHVPGKDPYIRDIFFDKEQGKYFTKGSTLPCHFDFSFSYPKKETIFREFQNCLNKFSGNHALVLAITCCTHQVVMKNEIAQEQKAIADKIPGTPVLAGYVFGEYGPSLTDQKSSFHSCSSVVTTLSEKQAGLEEESEEVNTFLHKTLNEQSKEISSLKKQVAFLESCKSNKMKLFAEDCLGIMLCRSHSSLSSIGEKLSQIFREYYAANNTAPPYAISRNRIIEHFAQIKKRGEVLLQKTSD